MISTCCERKRNLWQSYRLTVAALKDLGDSHGHGKKIIAIGLWNEWGEGSYIGPYARFGFGDLDQLAPRSASRAIIRRPDAVGPPAGPTICHRPPKESWRNRQGEHRGQRPTIFRRIRSWSSSTGIHDRGPLPEFSAAPRSHRSLRHAFGTERISVGGGLRIGCRFRVTWSRGRRDVTPLRKEGRMTFSEVISKISGRSLETVAFMTRLWS